MSVSRRCFLKIASVGSLALGLPLGCSSAPPENPPGKLLSNKYPQFSGIYPHLAFYNDENECGTGALAVWGGRLWAITYGPHLPFGSSDKLYEIDADLHQTVRSESVGGTHANRMIHRESEQLFIGPYVIKKDRRVRVILPEKMPGRLTGTARHLTDPAGKVYFATMEEGFYEVDVNSLEVTVINPDGNTDEAGQMGGALLPGYHGKGLYTGQGRLVYANNGENSPEALMRADITSGCLAQWNGEDWQVVRRDQFTEVTGPGGIKGNENVEDPLWTFGWDHRSALFMTLDQGQWHTYRMPKASHTYDGAHGWHTEWPRIRKIAPDRLVMTMHGMFWEFPKSFSAQNSAGIQPLSSYLKVIGDFCSWQGKVVCGCDDAARSDFRPDSDKHLKGTMAGQSNSNLWFIDPDRLSSLGPPIGRGGVWVDDPVEKDEYSDPYYFAGFERQMVHVRHDKEQPVTFSFEIDRTGNGTWEHLTDLEVPAAGYAYHIFDQNKQAEWIRARTDTSCKAVTLFYQFANADKRSVRPDPIFEGLARPDDSFTTGTIRPRGKGSGLLHFAADRVTADGHRKEIGYYEIGPDMQLQRVKDAKTHQWLKENFSAEHQGWTADEASVVVTDSKGQRYRLPKGPEPMRRPTAAGWPRVQREVVTERSLFNCQGHLYELPRDNSGGFARIRPIASSNHLIMDMCSWRGMLVIAGLADKMPESKHIVRSDDDRCGLWFGTIDDLWKLGKPRGKGGPWKNTKIQAGSPSDPYLMSGYDHKELTLAHAGNSSIVFTVEVDLTGKGDWATYQKFTVPPKETVTHRFPKGFNAYWARLKGASDVLATAQFCYS